MGEGRERLAGEAEPVARSMGRFPDVVIALAAGFLVVNGALLAVAWPEGDIPWAVGQATVLAIVTLVRVRRPELIVTAWFAISLAPSLLGEATNTGLSVLLESGSSAWSIAVVALCGGVAGALGVATMLWFMAVYPDQLDVTRWERRFITATWSVVLVPVVVALATPTVAVPFYIDGPRVENPLHVLPFSMSAGTAETVTGLPALLTLGGIVILVRHYRRSEYAVRRRMRWLLVPVPLIAFVVVFSVVLGDAAQMLLWIALLILVPALPAVAAVGILQPPGWDADWVLRRELVYGVMWLAIVGTLVVIAAVAGTTAGQYVPIEAAVVIAILVSLGFQPVRRRLEAIATRRVFGERVDHSGVITGLGATLASTFDLDTLLPRMVAALEHGLQLEWARVTLTGVPSEGSAPRPELVVPIEFEGEQLGVVECGPKRGGAWTDADRAVVETFAHQAALAVKNVRLTEQTARYAADVEVSRSRIARAAESERRRIERNIHDGIQQDLVVLIAMVGRVHDEMDPVTRSLAMAELRQRLERVLGDLRALARGIYPSLLTDQGIVPAVEALVASHPHRIRLRADPELRGVRFAEDIEGAAYFTVAEALTNSLKHARSSVVEVTLSRIDGALQVEVADDGIGFDTARAPAGHGLEGLADRVAALGGQFVVDAEQGRGTRVNASLSLAGGGST